MTVHFEVNFERSIFDEMTRNLFGNDQGIIINIRNTKYGKK